MNRSLIALAAALAGIVTTRPDDTGELPVLSLDDHGSDRRVLRGEAFTIELDGNPSAGYTWEIAEMDRRVLAPAGAPRFRPSGRLMGGGTTRFRFVAEESGETMVVLSYRRPWAPAEPLQTFRVRVIVD